MPGPVGTVVSHVAPQAAEPIRKCVVAWEGNPGADGPLLSTGRLHRGSWALGQLTIVHCDDTIH